ncbi:uncharacterized protein LOC126889913 [Diabrotica virgifera virgifera]|uniref:CHK kinase-like domain-containing protein n=1 Tax=Diabrotica virgifera virgifera TaxID=50390 RepID=A0ABM5KWM6_DIAVI|nr:uncharacterized protein LOC126889913 [Diabrotica virgifera virgifera]
MEALYPEVLTILKNIAVSEGFTEPQITSSGQMDNGEGFSGNVIFISITDKQRTKGLDIVVKQSNLNENVRDAIPVHTLYKNESYFYNRIWPELCKLQKTLPNIHRLNNIPKCFATDVHKDKECLIMENLMTQQFETIEKTATFSNEEVKYILTKYGKFHGLSFAYKAQYPDNFNEFCKMLSPYWKVQGDGKLFVSCLKDAVKKCEKYFGSSKDSKVTEALEKFSKNCVDLYKNSVTYRGNYGVITHGDCWSNNMMFKFGKNGKIEDMKFIDFQASSKASVVQDLSYFLYSGCDKQVLDNLDEYLMVYHKSLVETCSMLNCKEYISFEELKSEWKEYSFFGFMMSLIVFVVKYAIPEDMKKADMNKLCEEFNSGKELEYEVRIDEKMMEIKYKTIFNHMVEYNFL